MIKLYDKSISTISEQGNTISIWNIFIPNLIEQLSGVFIASISSMLMANFNQEAAVAISLSSQVINIFILILTIFSSGHLIVSSIYLGANKRDEAALSATSCLVTSIVLSSALGLILSAFPAPILRLMHLEGAALEYGCTYFSISVAFSVFGVCTSMLNTFLLSVGKAKFVTAFNLSRYLLGIGLSYVIIFRPFETPLYGVSGLAIGSVIINAAYIIPILCAVIKCKCPLSRQFSFRAVLQAAKIGIPGSMLSFFYTLSQVVTSSLISSLSFTLITAKTYANNIIVFISRFSFSLSIGQSIIIGRYKGQNEYDKANRLVLQNMFWGSGLNILAALLIIAAQVPIFSLYTSDSVILEEISKLLLINLIVEGLRGANHIVDRSLASSGDVHFVSIVSMVSCSLSILIGWLFGVHLGFGLIGFWIAFIIDEGSRLCIMLFRWRSGRWKNIKI